MTSGTGRGQRKKRRPKATAPAPRIRREARRQSLLVARRASEAEAVDDIDHLADLDDWK